MSLLDLDIKNYDYNDLLNLFKIEKNENRSNILYKLDKHIKKINDSNFDDYIVVFYKKARNIVIVINDLLDNDYISMGEISAFMDKIYNIDQKENISRLSEIDLMNKIKNNDISKRIPLNNLNEPNYNVNKMDYSLKGKNNTNTVFNVATNEVSPGDLNSIKRITQLLNLNLNSCFRNNYFQSNPTDFLYNLPVEIKNVLSMRLVSIEIPNSWYLFSSKKKNNIFYILVENKDDKKKSKQYTIEIPDGNYNFEHIENYLNSTYFYESEIDYPLVNIKFSINPHSLKTSFEIIKDKCEDDLYSYTIKFSLDINQNIINTAGWILGFRLANYINITTQISEGLFDAGGDRYVYLSINDFQYNNNTSNIVCFDENILNEDVIAKIPMENGKLSLIINDNNNNLAKIRRYNGPINLSKLQIKILDQFGAIIDLNNMDYSMTLELQLLYENFNFKNVTS
jgi:hypothetical protein